MILVSGSVIVLIERAMAMSAVDMIIDRRNMRDRLASILSVLQKRIAV